LILYTQPKGKKQGELKIPLLGHTFVLFEQTPKQDALKQDEAEAA
jgi:hypothetical protein